MRIPGMTVAVLLATCCFLPTARAATVTFGAFKDNTLYENPTGAVSDGQGPYMYVGKTGPTAGELRRRALIAFDLSSIPANATVQSATLTLTSSKSSFGGDASIVVHRATKTWGEGASNAGDPGGSGAPSTAGDATWIHNAFPGSLWASAGGDFVAAPSATTIVGFPNKYDFAGAQLTADIAAWIANPANNFGWLLTGDETNPNTAKRFNTHENTIATDRPSLSVTYTVPEPAALGLLGALIVPALARRRPRH